MKVLCIEDQDDIRLILRFTLEASDKYTVIEAATGADGVEQAAREQPDLILLDYSLPDMDGPYVLKELKASPLTAAIPVIILTAKTVPAELDACKAAGALDVLLKPFDPGKLPTQIEQILGREGRH